MAVKFIHEGHKYVHEDGTGHVSVTTLVSKYAPKFDAHYWSTYKAMKEVLEKHGKWQQYKTKCGGWENVVPYVREIDKAFPLKEEVLFAKKRYLAEWKKESEDALVEGSKFHAHAEARILSSEKVVVNGKEYTTVNGAKGSGDLVESFGFDGNRLVTEMLIWDKEFRLAGQSDKVLFEGKYVDIVDYKTSKEISNEPFMEERMLSPISHLYHTDFIKYALQLSLYAYMLERRGYVPRDLWIDHVCKKTYTVQSTLKMPYLKDEAMALLSELEYRLP